MLYFLGGPVTCNYNKSLYDINLEPRLELCYYDKKLNFLFCSKFSIYFKDNF